ncbi:hypothetical protein HHK36_028724 [Tetracentron sinense]|uniref:Uncharacterized protein n=1 Tax=Tetracentron sinense TaxID=13715 RepID=A0A834YFX9_TETSI|nr:hypothetical protein HHK36_028724 [Tetracentron sinense]
MQSSNPFIKKDALKDSRNEKMEFSKLYYIGNFHLSTALNFPSRVYMFDAELHCRSLTISSQMDLETENRIAAILMKEAAELRLQAEKEGIDAYLRQPNVRGRPNSRFLTATVRGVQQANRVAEVNEMWRVRQKELELDDRLKGRSRDKSSSSSNSHRDHSDPPKSTSTRCRETDKDAADLRTSRKRGSEDCYTSEDGLKDEEIEEFLHSRVKRGRGAIGSRMDETGPYLPPSVSQEKLFANHDVRVKEEWESRVLLPEKPSFLKSHKSSEDELERDSWKKANKDDSVSSKKRHSKKHRSKDKSPIKKREKKYKHRKSR